MFRSHRRFSPAIYTLAAIMCVLLPACSLIVHEYGGAFDREPEELAEMISPEGAALIKKAFTGIDDQTVLDYHTHIIGLGTSCEECFVHSSFTSFFIRCRGSSLQSICLLQELKMLSKQTTSLSKDS